MSDTQDLLFELGCEELPPTSLCKLIDSLQASVKQGLADANLDHGPVHAYATPRRLALWIESLATQQPDRELERRGPALAAAYDAEGQPSKATQGFLRGCGPDVQPDQLETLKTDKGEWLLFRQQVAGQSAESLIPDILRKALAQLPIAKRMRWGAREDEFVRPVHWVVLLFGEQVIDCNILGVSSGNASRGHRFHANHAIELSRPGDYADRLKQDGKVLVDFVQRQSMIREQAIAAAEAVGGSAHIEDDLLEEVTALVEWPVAVTGQIDQRFLSLPKEALITTMQSNQKYFPVLDADGALLPYFITISNIESSNPASVKHGNERVVRPRLSDAEFFWNQDRKSALQHRVQTLDHIIYQRSLGTLGDKVRRVVALSERLAKQLDGDVALASRAALLCKTDLLTQMVGEFASLQGIMGRYYAQADGEPEAVAVAIEEHYFPKQAGAPLPSGLTGDIVAIADKIDTIYGIFSVNLIPTGDKDPYALRRAALGVLRILVEHDLNLDLTALLSFAGTLFSHDFNATETERSVAEFILDRFRGYSISRGYTAEEFESVARVAPLRPAEFDRRLQAVKQFMSLPEANNLCAANKRIHNLLKKSADVSDETFEPGKLSEPAEKALLEALRAVNAEVTPKIAQSNFTVALQDLSRLQQPVDRFFDEILVMTEDDSLRLARLGLLQQLHRNFTQIADISVL